jgi:hypothetical protein
MHWEPRAPEARDFLWFTGAKAGVHQLGGAREAEDLSAPINKGSVADTEGMISREVDRDVGIEKDALGHDPRLSAGTPVLHGVEIGKNLLGRAVIGKLAEETAETDWWRAASRRAPLRSGQSFWCRTLRVGSLFLTGAMPTW